jgi:hypothetical protein
METTDETGTAWDLEGHPAHEYGCLDLFGPCLFLVFCVAVVIALIR